MKLIIFIFTFFTLTTLSAQNVNNKDLLDKWVAGQTITDETLHEFGIENCFKSHEISPEIFNRIKGLSYKDNCTVPLTDLNYIKVLHYNIDDEICIGEMICHHSISKDLLQIFRTLFDAHYPIERMVLVDNYNAEDELSMMANNSSGFNFRFVSGTTRLSNHSLGLAVDINPLYNPYVKTVNNKVIVEPAESTKYVNRDNNFPYKIEYNDLCYKEFTKHGFTWGGNWKSVKDYQHFEKKP
ncbi:MAG: M15 family metallopeptidase [Rikenellaceae bacterium]